MKSLKRVVGKFYLALFQFLFKERKQSNITRVMWMKLVAD